MGKEIICICGSTKFKDEIIQIQKDLTLQGYIVIGMHLFSQDEGIELTKEQLIMLKEKHRLKISLSEAIYVVNPNGYIGDSTREEIEFAISKGKKIMSLEPLKIPESVLIEKPDDHSMDWMAYYMSPSEKLTTILAGIGILLFSLLLYFI